MTRVLVADNSKRSWQGRANWWVRRLESFGFEFCGEWIFLFTDANVHDVTVGWISPTLDEDDVEWPTQILGPKVGPSSDCLGLASHDDGAATIFVEVDSGDTDDPVNTLIHELLHHVTPQLGHRQVYWLAAHLRAGNMCRPKYVRTFGDADELSTHRRTPKW